MAVPSCRSLLHRDVEGLDLTEMQLEQEAVNAVTRAVQGVDGVRARRLQPAGCQVRSVSLRAP